MASWCILFPVIVLRMSVVCGIAQVVKFTVGEFTKCYQTVLAS